MHMKFIFNSGFIVFVSFLLLEQQTFAGQSPQTDTQKAATQGLKLDTGQEIFEAACIGCHGPGGKGLPETTLGFAHPPTYPDFSDCNGSTRERTFDWKVTIHEGGHGRRFSEIMPSFAEALTAD